VRQRERESERKRELDLRYVLGGTEEKDLEPIFWRDGGEES
jgi:hypothetical protein